jgi:hypothetical protein
MRPGENSDISYHVEDLILMTRLKKQREKLKVIK